MKFKTGDKVIVIAGKEKGHTGRIGKILKKDNTVIVEGLNLVKKHVKPNANNQNGGIVSVEAPIHASNVMLFNEKENKGTRKRVASEKVEAKKAPKKAKAKKD